MWTVPPEYLGVIAALFAFGAFALLVGAPVLGVAFLITATGTVVVSILYLAATGKLPPNGVIALPQQGGAPAAEQIPPQANPDSPPEPQCPHELPQ